MPAICRVNEKNLMGLTLACMVSFCTYGSVGKNSIDTSNTTSRSNNQNPHATSHLMWYQARMNGIGHHCANEECKEPPLDSSESKSYVCYGVPRILFTKGAGSLPEIRRKDKDLYKKVNYEIGQLAKLIDSVPQKRADPAIIIQVIGHASSEGSDAINGGLSYTRARTVEREIRKHLSGRTRVIFVSEGRGAFEPWPDIKEVPEKCKQTKEFKTSFLAIEKPLDGGGDIEATFRLSRRVEIRISSSSLVSAAVGVEYTNDGKLELSRRLAFYPTGTQPGHLLTVPLTPSVHQLTLPSDIPAVPLKPSFDKPQKRASMVMSALTEPINPAVVTPPFEEVPQIGSVDGMGSLYARLRIVPVYRSDSRKNRIPDDIELVLDLARFKSCDGKNPTLCIGMDAPSYWVVHQRVADYVQQQITLLVNGTSENRESTEFKRQQAIKALVQYDESDGASGASRKTADVAKNSLVLVPKDIDGLMAHAHGLHRERRFVDLRAGTNITVRSAAGVPLWNYPLWMGSSATFFAQSDPIHPCAPDPRPRILDQDSAIVLDPFAAWMSFGGPSCNETSIDKDWTTSEQTSLEDGLQYVPCATLKKDKSGICTVRTFDDLQALLQRGPSRLFLPPDKVPLNGGGLFVDDNSSGKLDPNKLDQFGTFLMVGRRTRDLERATKDINKADKEHWKLGTWCRTSNSDNHLDNIICGIVLAAQEISVDLTTTLNSSAKRVTLGTRIVHVLPETLSRSCLTPTYSSFNQGNLKAQLAVSFGDIGSPVLLDNTDCHLLALPLINGSHFSWTK